MIILTFILNYTKTFKEGFFNFPDINHNTFIQNSQNKYNEITNSINLTNPIIPLNSDTSNKFNIALSGLITIPSQNIYNLESQNNYSVPNQIPNNYKQAQFCESKPANCSAFDDEEFANNCGISFDKNGIGFNGKPHIGGMYVSSDDRNNQLNNANNVLKTGGPPYDPFKIYQPTLGKSKPGTFALTKDQCLIVKEKIDCESKQSFNSPNCVQCYTSQKFGRIGPDTGKIPSTLFLTGSGTVYIQSADSKISLDNTTLSIDSPIQVNIPADAEGTVFSVVIQKTDNVIIPYISGYLQGQTSNGLFKIDLFNIVEIDQVSKTKPKINGTITINGFKCLTMVPGTGQTYLNLACLMPFSFLNMYDGDALMCDNGPIISKSSSATFLESDPCFSKENQPGNYKLECLQQRWVELGGTQQGLGYPSNLESANAIQKDKNGNNLDIDTIINNLSPKMTTALTGKDSNGNQLSISNWNTVSMWATGIPINTPCDGPNKDNGPLSQECLSYLYLNQGINSHIGPTYTLPSSQSASMLGQPSNNTYCQPGTEIDPKTDSGLKFGQSLGGINSVKQKYDESNRLANDNTLPNEKRAEAIKQCYGIIIDNPPIF